MPKHVYLFFALFIASTCVSITTSQAATLFVDTPLGQPGCDLIDAINSANNNVSLGGCIGFNAYGDDLINVKMDQILTSILPGTQNGLPTIHTNIRINGISEAGSNQLIKVARDDVLGTPEFRIFHVQHPGQLTLSNIEVSNGSFATDAGSGFIPGAGIYSSSGDLTLLDVLMTGHHGEVGTIFIAGGEGDPVLLKIHRSSFHDNHSFMDAAVLSIGDNVNAAIYDTTFSNNHTNGFGGAVRVSGFVDDLNLSIYNSTFSGNSARSGGALIIESLTSSITSANRSVTLRNNIFSGNTSNSALGGGDIYIGERSTDLEYPSITLDNNIIGHSGISEAQSIRNLTGASSGNLLATSDGNLPTELRNIIDLMELSLKGLAYHAPADGSPAIDAGVPFRVFGGGPLFLFFYEPGCTGVLIGINAPQSYRPDQIGRERPIGDECDIGAIEYEPEPEQCYVVPTANDKTVVFCL